MISHCNACYNQAENTKRQQIVNNAKCREADEHSLCVVGDGLSEGAAARPYLAKERKPADNGSRAFQTKGPASAEVLFEA